MAKKPPKPASKLTDAEWADVRTAFEETAEGLRSIGDRYGISGEAVRKRAARDGWERSSVVAVAAAEERRLRTSAARAEADRSWASTRVAKANAFGRTVDEIHRLVLGHLLAPDGTRRELGDETLDWLAVDRGARSLRRFVSMAEDLSIGSGGGGEQSAVGEWLAHVAGDDELLEDVES